jgi:hypothetical protein
MDTPRWEVSGWTAMAGNAATEAANEVGSE